MLVQVGNNSLQKRPEYLHCNLPSLLNNYIINMNRTDFREGLFVRVDEVFPIDIFMLSDYVSKQVKFDLKKNHKGLGTLKSETVVFYYLPQ